MYFEERLPQLFYHTGFQQILGSFVSDGRNCVFAVLKLQQLPRKRYGHFGKERPKSRPRTGVIRLAATAIRLTNAKACSVALSARCFAARQRARRISPWICTRRWLTHIPRDNLRRGDTKGRPTREVYKPGRGEAAFAHIFFCCRGPRLESCVAAWRARGYKWWIYVLVLPPAK